MQQCRLSPQKLIFLLYGWIVPYILMANYLERSLFPFRTLCYTQSDLLTNIAHPSIEKCVERIQPGVQPNKDCHLNSRPNTILHPRFPKTFDSIAVIRTAPRSLDYRTFIRETWKTHLTPDVPVVFVTALKDGVDLQKENDEFGDILQFNFADSYHNLSYKMMSTYGYVLEELPHVNEIIVINDDTIVNATAVRDLPRSHSSEKWVIGKVSRGYPRLWMWWLPWYVPGSMFPNLCYPRFTQGSSFVISKAGAKSIFENICRFPFIQLDDIMMGVMSQCLGIEQKHHDGFDHHSFDEFVVFHYQYSRYTPDYLKNLWIGSQFDF